jgi:y4mF family transcriptional regulator
VNSKEIGSTIKKRRQELKVNQLTLSELAGVGINTLVAIERGTGNPKLETLLSVLDTLGLQLNITLKD